MNFLASTLGLFLELALIRFVSSEVRIFAYCTNLVLIACVLGFGAGCLWHARRSALLPGMAALLVLCLALRLPWEDLTNFGPQGVTAVFQNLADLAVFHDLEQAPALRPALGLAFAVCWTVAAFFLLVLVMVPYGQVVGAALARSPSPLRAYSVNVAGSLAGIMAFTAMAAAQWPPLLWFVPPVLLSVPLARGAARRLLPVAAVLLAVVLWPRGGPDGQEIWTPYHKLNVSDRGEILVNNTGYQNMYPVAITALDGGRMNRWVLPYATRRPAGRVLIVGAGSGNDAAAALQAGATSVTAVEIDPAIYRIGLERHPQRPYSDPRVRVVLDDARHFLRTTAESYDIIVFSHLDAHTLLSGLTTVRLDSYIHDVEGFQDARSRLAPGGVMYAGYWCPETFIAARLQRNIELAFGFAPVALQRWYHSAGRPVVEAHFLIGERGVMPALERLRGRWPEYAAADFRIEGLPPSTDDWPYLALRDRAVPPLMLLVSLAVLAVSAAVAVRVRPPGERFDGRLFFLGAAFMALEVHNVSRLALVFGTTWQVNAWVIGTILAVILLANALQTRYAGALARMAPVLTAALFSSLALCAFVPLRLLFTKSSALGGSAATLMLTLPIFFAALVFARAFSSSPTPGFALGWNILGAVAGGLTENICYVWGMRSLVFAAAAYYVLALLWPQGSPRRPLPADPGAESPRGG